jgi:hypothetical protein
MIKFLLTRFYRPVKIVSVALLWLFCFSTTNAFSYAPLVQAKVIKCYPNPATSYINFEFANEIDKSYSLQIYSFVGRLMFETIVSNSKLTVELNNNYYRGIYIYQLHDKSGRIVEAGKFQVTK